MVTAIPLSGLLVFQNIYAISVVRKQVADSQRDVLAQYLNRIDADLDDIDKYLITRLLYDPALIIFDRAGMDNEYNLAKIDLSNEFTQDISINNSMHGIFAYSIITNDIVMSTKYSSELTALNSRDVILELMGKLGMQPTPHWIAQSIERKVLLFRVLKASNYLLGAWIDVDALLAPLKASSPGSRSEFLLVANGGISYPYSAAVDDNDVDILSNNQEFRITGAPKRFLVINSIAATGDFKLVAVIPDSAILEQLPTLLTTNILVAASALLLVLFFFFTVRSVTLRPLDELMSSMIRLRQGDLSARIEPNKDSREFAVAGETFNQMASQIRDLRIGIYEEQLHAQRAELLSLRLQINPHFLLNSLNIIYQLAQVKDIALVQEMTLCLSKYFRFMYRSGADLVRLSDEWDHLKNYLRIQELRFPEGLSCDLRAPEPIPGIDIPPLLLHTFAENSVQHGARQDSILHLSVSIESLPAEGRLCIRVEDSGPGFSASTLEALADGGPILSQDGERIGIANIKRRLRLIYGGAALLQLRNRPPPESGAIVEISIPCASS